RLYYRFGYGSYSGAEACVETVRYKGIVSLACTSSACDTPYNFYAFEQVSFSGSYGGINIPSLKQAQQSVLTCDELIEHLRDHKRTEMVESQARRIEKGLEALSEPERETRIVTSIEQLRLSGIEEGVLADIEWIVRRPSARHGPS
ncbi:MAG TPA: hypothetical protein VG125_27490, partial [Pirellulales bacterium]|nr:hypothetical protein [Pirellulales bacterium]